MEKQRSSKIVAIVALCVAVVGLSLGFAAFSNTLTISSSANVKPNASTFNIDISSSASSVATSAVTPTKNPTTLTATSATLDNTSDPTIKGLSATFTEPGQDVTYTFYVHNVGEYIAYLNSITYANATGGNSPIVCTAGSGTDATLVANACKGISLTVTVGGVEVTGSKADISSHSLAIDGHETLTVKLAYASDAARADGDFTVAFGDVTLTYDSVD